MPYLNGDILVDFNNNERPCFASLDPFQRAMLLKCLRQYTSTVSVLAPLTFHMFALAFQAFYNYHVLELLQMLVTGGISSQLEQHLDKSICGMVQSYSSVLSGRMRCKLGLLSLDQTILSDIKVSLLLS